MSIELPSDIAYFLQLIGINRPNIDEDQVRAFGRHVRDFADDIDGTHQAASGTVQQMSAAYQGSSYEQLVAVRAGMSSSHMTELIEGCHVVADAMDVAADAIVQVAKTLVNDQIKTLEAHVLNEVVNKAVQPLESIVERAVSGLAFNAAQWALGVPADGGSSGASMGIVPDELMGYAQKLQGHGEEIAGHAQTFASAISGVSFGE